MTQVPKPRPPRPHSSRLLQVVGPAPAGGHEAHHGDDEEEHDEDGQRDAVDAGVRGGGGGRASSVVLVSSGSAIGRCGRARCDQLVRGVGAPGGDEHPEQLVPEEERQPAQSRLVVGVAAHPHQRHDRHEQQHTGGSQHARCVAGGACFEGQGVTRCTSGARGRLVAAHRGTYPVVRRATSGSRSTRLTCGSGSPVKRPGCQRGSLARLEEGDLRGGAGPSGRPPSHARRPAEVTGMTGFIPAARPLHRRRGARGRRPGAAQRHAGAGPGGRRVRGGVRRALVARPAPASRSTPGTSGLHLGLLAAGVGPGDEVIVPSFTFAATANSVALTGATPVFADIEPDDFCLDPAAVEAAVTARTVGHHAGAPVRAPGRRWTGLRRSPTGTACRSSRTPPRRTAPRCTARPVGRVRRVRACSASTRPRT